MNLLKRRKEKKTTKDPGSDGRRHSNSMFIHTMKLNTAGEIDAVL